MRVWGTCASYLLAVVAFGRRMLPVSSVTPLSLIGDAFGLQPRANIATNSRDLAFMEVPLSQFVPTGPLRYGVISQDAGALRPILAALFVTVTTVTTLGSAATVLPGVEVFLSDVPAALRGKRVGLITNSRTGNREAADFLASRKPYLLYP